MQYSVKNIVIFFANIKELFNPNFQVLLRYFFVSLTDLLKQTDLNIYILFIVALVSHFLPKHLVGVLNNILNNHSVRDRYSFLILLSYRHTLEQSGVITSYTALVIRPQNISSPFDHRHPHTEVRNNQSQ